MSDDEIIKLQEQLNKVSSELSQIRNHVLNLNSIILAQSYNAKSFRKYKNFFYNKSVVLVATGPSAAIYKQMSEAIHVGVNGAIYLDNVSLDYIFVQDYPLITNGFHKNLLEDVIKYKSGQCEKFFGIIPPVHHKTATIRNSEIDRIPLSYILQDSQIKPYIIEEIAVNNWAYDLENQPMGNFIGTVFSALQFILYCNPKKLYLVGCDCSTGHAYTNSEDNRKAPYQQIDIWRNRVKPYIERFFPKLEIYVINPVNLKGVFKEYKQ